jgi:hypothetical protein
MIKYTKTKFIDFFLFDISEICAYNIEHIDNFDLCI